MIFNICGAKKRQINTDLLDTELYICLSNRYKALLLLFNFVFYIRSLNNNSSSNLVYE